MRRLFIHAVLIIIIATMTGCQLTSNQNLHINLENDRSPQTLTIGLVSTVGSVTNILGDRIRAFDGEHPDIEIHFVQDNNRLYYQISPWLIGLEGREAPPDIVEVPYTLMQYMYHHGKIEQLNMNETKLQGLVIKAPDGSVIGVKSKVNPLVVYYNQEIFNAMGLEEPSGEWEWDMLDQTIATLKKAGHNVYIMLSPFTLEWLAMNRYGGRISDPYSMKFGGYLDSEASIRAAEWFAWVGTKEEDYELPSGQAFPMPSELIKGNMALAIDYAHRVVGHYHYESIIQRNDQINIAPLPGGPETSNLAQMTGLSILSKSPNRDVAMKLLRYLTNDSEGYIHDIASYTLQAWQGVTLGVDWIDPGRASTILQEIGRSVPATLFMSDDYSHGFNFNSEHAYPFLREIIDGRPTFEALEQYAQQLDVEFQAFWDNPEAYGECIKNGRELCVR